MNSIKIELLAETPNLLKVIERAARTSYQSYNKMKEGSEEKLIKMIIKLGHESVLEHASVSFIITGISRAATHQLVRHRLASYTQKSQRYVSEENFEYIIPPSIEADDKTKKLFIEQMKAVKELYKKFKDLGIKNEDARYILPNATSSEIVFTTNIRELRHIIRLRCDKKAQWEIRYIFCKIYKIMKEKYPVLFYDMNFSEENHFLDNIKWG